MAEDEKKETAAKKPDPAKSGSAKPAAKDAPKPAKVGSGKPVERPTESKPSKPAGKDEKSSKPEPEDKATGKKGEEEEDDEDFLRKPKPDLSHEQARLMKVRREASTRRPYFYRQNAHLFYRLMRTGWRKPRGLQSMTRQHEKSRVNVVSIGYRGPVEVRNLHANGFEEVLVANEKELKGLDPKRQAVRIRAGVGRRKRESLEEAAEDLGLWILNRKMEHYVVRIKEPSQIAELGLTAKGDKKRPGGDAILIDSSVTERMRDEIIAEAEDRGIRVLNPGSGRG